MRGEWCEGGEGGRGGEREEGTILTPMKGRNSWRR